MASMEELRKNPMMRHLLDALESGEDIGHYGRLVFVMVARHFLSKDELISVLSRGGDCDEPKARALVSQVEQHGYTPPSRAKILEFQSRQSFPIVPNPDDPDQANVYRDLQFPDAVYGRIEEYYEDKTC